MISKADPLKYIFTRPTLNWQLEKGAIIQQYNVEYVLQKEMKGQALVDFLAAYLDPDESPLITDLPDKKVTTIIPQKAWEMYLMVLQGAQREKERKPAG